MTHIHSVNSCPAASTAGLTVLGPLRFFLDLSFLFSLFLAATKPCLQKFVFILFDVICRPECTYLRSLIKVILAQSE